MKSMTRALALPALAPAGAARGGMTEPVAEIVTFRLSPDAGESDFLAAARATDRFVRATPGFVSRRLTRGEDGRWTDYVEWRSLAEAMAAAEALMADPATAPFLRAIDVESVVMRHESLLWSVAAD